VVTQASNSESGGVSHRRRRLLGAPPAADPENCAEATFADARRPVVFGLPHDLHALGVDDVDVANDIGAVVAGTLDFDPAIGRAGRPPSSAAASRGYPRKAGSD
jgi:hypothetical protein